MHLFYRLLIVFLTQILYTSWNFPPYKQLVRCLHTKPMRETTFLGTWLALTNKVLVHRVSVPSNLPQCWLKRTNPIRSGRYSTCRKHSKLSIHIRLSIWKAGECVKGILAITLPNLISWAIDILSTNTISSLRVTAFSVLKPQTSQISRIITARYEIHNACRI